MQYVDGFVLPVSKKKLAAYRRLSQKAGKIWREHGALDYKECAGDDMKVTPEHQSRQAQASLTQQQDGAITKTNPYSQFDSDWYLNARPVVTMQPVDAHAATAQSVVPATATEGDVT